MFPASFFGPRFYASRYFPKVGDTAVLAEGPHARTGNSGNSGGVVGDPAWRPWGWGR